MYGVDTAAHKTAIAAGGITIAVLAHGLNYIYPPENKELYQLIIQSGGCIISEYPDNFKPQLWTYPKRNRIVAALSKKGTLVIEAAEQSGSLITASYADALNRPLFAPPGSVFSKTSEGTNRIIKDAIAQMVLSADDIVPSIVSENRKTPSLFEDLTELEKKILDELSSEELSVDELSLKLSEGVVDVGTTLTMLSMRNIVKEVEGKYQIHKK
jgi:DNA processing protein